ncbi:helix-turn-helix domain-containing protein [Nocardia sp. NPDC051990]|uniref:TetR/AcrR family transcriptional regulator n=1 Tax=Nocardia sp. NPDC051990 TaxID=3155285 RepID=UPI0034483357
MKERGPYGKGIERREQILDATLRTIAERGFHATSVAELADAVGLSQSGLLHYFGSKEALFIAVLRRRSELDIASLGPDPDPSTYATIIERNTKVPGLTELFTHMQAAAADHRHPAHEFMIEHYRRSSEVLTSMLQQLQDDGAISSSADTRALATQVLAMTDGLQSRWLIDPTIDMAAELESFWQMLIRSA